MKKNILAYFVSPARGTSQKKSTSPKQNYKKYWPEKIQKKGYWHILCISSTHPNPPKKLKKKINKKYWPGKNLKKKTYWHILCISSTRRIPIPEC
jgi:hypothetical protein